MKEFVNNVLLPQSPALFLAAVLLIVRYFIIRNKHRVRAVVDLILGILCIAGGVVLYFVGIDRDVFTIKDFWHIRIAGYVGLAIVALLFLILLFRSAAHAVEQRREKRVESRRENARQKELEEVRQKAYADGMADAMAAESKLTSEEPVEEIPVDAPVEAPVETSVESSVTPPAPEAPADVPPSDKAQ